MLQHKKEEVVKMNGLGEEIQNVMRCLDENMIII